MLGKINSIGVNIPIMKEVYEPVLDELKDYGVIFKEKEEIIK
jgi:saccharopine dehydrogenase (NADP+, L-glutamate forming)